MFRGRLSKLRNDRGLTQKELANRLGMARTTYSGYENGSREPDHQTLQKFADYFDTSIDYLLGRTDDKKTLLPSEQSDNEKMAINLSDDELLKIPIYYEDMELTLEEKIEFISIVRAIFSARRALKEKT